MHVQTLQLSQFRRAFQAATDFKDAPNMAKSQKAEPD